MKKLILIFIFIFFNFHLYSITVFDNLNQKELSLEDLSFYLENSQVIYIGETHDNKTHHKAQLEIIKLLFDSDISVGMEYFNRRYNNVLTDFFVHDKFSFDDFLNKSGYFNTWGFDIDLYRDIFLFLNENNIPGFGINLDRNIVSSVSKRGLDSLNVNQRLQLPFLHINHFPEHREFIKNIFSDMGSKMGFSPEMFKNFYHAQVVWEDVMAHSVWAQLRQDFNQKVIVLVGKGHIQYKFGIPQRVYKRIKHAYCTMIPVAEEDVSANMKSVDYADFLLIY
ncbi:MAG: ChaN family lipoprotein [Candidatus Muiribacteriota bacterium]